MKCCIDDRMFHRQCSVARQADSILFMGKREILQRNLLVDMGLHIFLQNMDKLLFV